MPLITPSTYTSPTWLHNGHLQTIIPSLLRKIEDITYKRERITTEDGDFLDLDWLNGGFNRLTIISHGLEGDSQRPYVKGMARAFYRAGWDVLCWNFRGCSGEINKSTKFYHSGSTDDLQFVTEYALHNKYEDCVYIGFSLGGNLTLKHLGENAMKLSKKLRAAVVFSVPLHLQSSSEKIAKASNWIYNKRFLKNLKAKIQAKAKILPEEITLSHFEKIKTLQDFDEFYTAPLHGFKNATDYYTLSSAVYFLPQIEIPTLIVNALNDPFLSPQCFPASLVKNLTAVFLETPKEGGHCGFPRYHTNGVYWSESRALEFVKEKALG